MTKDRSFADVMRRTKDSDLHRSEMMHAREVKDLDREPETEPTKTSLPELVGLDPASMNEQLKWVATGKRIESQED